MIPEFSNWMNILLNWINPNSNCWINFWIKFLNQFLNQIFRKDRLLNIFFKLNIPEKMISFELNFIVKWMNESYFGSIFAIFDEKFPFLSILNTFWAIFGHYFCSTSINDFLTIELNYLLNWISRIFFKVNDILN